MDSILQIARAYVGAGLSVIPIGLDGQKKPDFSLLPTEWDETEARGKVTWNPFKINRPDDHQLDVWFGKGTPAGLAVVAGKVSGNAECIDIDEPDVANEFMAEVQVKWKELFEILVWNRSPSNGLHIWYRCDEIGGNEKLAWPDAAECEAAGRPFKILIETKGEGGYVIAPGSPLSVHKTGRPYQHLAGPKLTQIKRIHVSARKWLMEFARSYDRSPKRPLPNPPEPVDQGYRREGASPADDYDERGPSFDDLLSHTGAALVSGTWDDGKVRRPGKEDGYSATVGHCKSKTGAPLLYVFSASWPPFEAEKSYGKYHVLRLLKFDGDGSKAMAWCRQQGFGGKLVQGEGPAHEKNGTPKINKPTSKKPGENSSALIIRPFEKMNVKPVRYAIPGRFAFGKVTLIAGAGGEGKTTLVRRMAADLSAGRPTLGMEYDPPGPCKVLLLSAEDGPEDTTLPHLLAEGAIIKNIGLLDGVKVEGKKRDFTLKPEHIEMIKQRLLADPLVRVIIIDPIATYVGRSRIDDHKSTELRQVLDPLNELAEATGVLIIILAHVNKSNAAAAVDRIAGSAAYKDAVRSAYLVATDPEDSGRRLLMPIKENLPGFVRSSIPYRLMELTDPDAEAVMMAPQFGMLSLVDREIVRKQLRRVYFEPAFIVDANSVMRPQKDDGTKVERCAEWLEAFLKDYAYPSTEIAAAARANGFTFDNQKEAKLLLKTRGLQASNADSFKGKWWTGFGPPADWILRPEPFTPTSPPTPQTPFSPHTSTKEQDSSRERGETRERRERGERKRVDRTETRPEKL